MISECSNHNMCIVVYEGRNCPYCADEETAAKKDSLNEEKIHELEDKVDELTNRIEEMEVK